MTTTLTSPKVRRSRGARKSTAGSAGHATAHLLVPAMASSYDAAEKLIQRMEAQVTAFARLAAAHPVLRDRLRKTIAAAVDVIRLGAPLQWSSDLCASLAVHDGSEDGPLARCIANPESIASVKAWLRLAEAEQEARAEVMAAARAWLRQAQLVGVPQ